MESVAKTIVQEVLRVWELRGNTISLIVYHNYHIQLVIIDK